MLYAKTDRYFLCFKANHKSATSQASAFLSHLERRSDRDYYKFFDALKSMDMYDTLLKLTGY